MYNFVDTIEVSEGALLPSEALQINGEYIEHLIDGYRTLSVSGREALSSEIETTETGIRDGSTKKSKRYPARTIIVKYQLLAATNEAFREAYNKLGGILNVEDAELIFNDEQDKFYTGTPSAIGEVEPGTNKVIGEFEILCVDPFKYSVVEYEATPTLEESTILVDYNGTYKSYPILEAAFFNENEASDDDESSVALTGSGDCGYVAFFNDKEKIIQLGDPKEEDVETYAKSQTLINYNFKKSGSWGTAAKLLWAQNSGEVSSDSYQQTGTLGMAVAAYKDDGTGTTTGTILKKKASTASVPVFYYTVSAKAYDRTTDSVKVELSITASMGTTTNYFGNGLGLVASVYIGGKWQEVTLKKTSEYWRGKSGHTVNKTVTVTGLEKTTESLTGLKFKVSRSDSNGNAGTLGETACSNLKISKYTTPEVGSYYLKTKDYGSGAKFHGASISRNIPADAAGDVGAKNFNLTFTPKIAIGSGKNDTNQCGAFQFLLTNTSGKTVAGISVYKSKAGKKAKLRYYANGKTLDTIDVDISANNKRFNLSKACTIKKTGKTISFNIGGLKSSFNSTAVANLTVTKMTVGFYAYGTKAALKHNGVQSIKFVKNNCDTFEDIENKFSANDIVEADCKNADILLNGVSEPMYGALGNDWEEFYLEPGLNQIGFSYSDWVEDAYAPNVKVRYREVFL